MASPLLSTSFVFGDAVLNFVGVFVIKLLVVLSFLFGLDVQISFLVGLVDVDGDEERNKPAARAANVVLSTTTLGGS